MSLIHTNQSQIQPAILRKIIAMLSFLLETMNTGLGRPIAVKTSDDENGSGANLANVGCSVLCANYAYVMATNKNTQTALTDLSFKLPNKFKD